MFYSKWINCLIFVHTGLISSRLFIDLSSFFSMHVLLHNSNLSQSGIPRSASPFLGTTKSYMVILHF